MKDLCHLTLQKPPEFLFYAVDAEYTDKIFRQGLLPQNSLFVEVYATVEQAKRKTNRRGFPFTFVIVARVMADDGFRFYHAETGEWLTDEIPPKYIRLQ